MNKKIKIALLAGAIVVSGLVSGTDVASAHRNAMYNRNYSTTENSKVDELIKEKNELIQKKKSSRNGIEQKELGMRIGEIEREISKLQNVQGGHHSINQDKINHYNKMGRHYRGQADTNKSDVYFNGKAHHVNAYKFNDNNYFKLRDLAMLSKGTGCKFNIHWDDVGNTIDIMTDEDYSSVGGELGNISAGLRDVLENESGIRLNGKVIKLESYTIDGNNYFKLRDLAEAIGFEVDWDSNNNRVIINM